MRRIRSILVFAAFLCLFSCGRGVPRLEEGVSEALYAFRSELISDVHYDVAFRIPAALEERVTGQETITFSLERRTELPIDFRAEREAVTGLEVNGAPCPVDLRCEHIILDRKWLRKGPNTVSLCFVCGDRSLNRNPGYLYTLFVPDRARTVLPCFDQPDLKGRFTLTLDIPAAWGACFSRWRRTARCRAKSV